MQKAAATTTTDGQQVLACNDDFDNALALWASSLNHLLFPGEKGQQMGDERLKVLVPRQKDEDDDDDDGFYWVHLPLESPPLAHLVDDDDDDDEGWMELGVD